MTIGTRLIKIMKYRNISQEKLADLVGCTQSAISKIIDNTSKRSKFIIEIAKALECHPDWLYEGIGIDPTTSPVLANVSQINLIPIVEWEESLKKQINIAVKYKNGSCQCFGIYMKDDSMISPMVGNHSFLPGDLLIIDPDVYPDHQDFVLVLEKNSEFPLFKQYIIQGKKTYLNSLNPTYSSIELSPDMDIKGTLIEQRRNIKLLDKC